MSKPSKLSRLRTVGSLARVLPHVWPHRKKLFLSFAFAMLVALLWGANLSVAFPVVKVLIQGESLDQYVEKEIESAKTEVAKRTARIETVNQLLGTDTSEEQLHAEEAAHRKFIRQSRARIAELQEQLKDDPELFGARDEVIQLEDRVASAGTQADALASRARDLAALTRDERIQLLKDRSKHQEKLSAASRALSTMEWVKSNILPWLPGDQFDLLAFIFAITLVAIIIKGLCVFAQDVLIGNVVELTAMSIRKDCFRKALALDYQTLHLTGTADLMSRFTHDMQVLSYSLRLIGGKIIREPLKAICCITAAMLVCWQLTLLSMLFVPLIGFVFYRIGRALKLASRRMMESMSRIYKTLEETFEALKVVIAFNGARTHRQRFHRENKEYYRKAQRIVSVDSLTSPTIEVLGLLTAFIALLPGAYLVLRHTTRIWGITLSSHQLDVAELSLLYVLLAGVIDPMRKLSTTYTKLKRGSAAADRVFGLMRTIPLVKDPENPQELPRHARSIAFHGVQFSYARPLGDGGIRPSVINDVSLNVRAGEVVAVVGENGSGKSTLVNMLPRLFDADSGEVRIDGVNIREVRLRDLRDQIGIVTQETLLFDDSIYENIRYGKPSASREEIERAAEQAYVIDFLDQLPDGLDTHVGEKGNRLSGGQRQRIALARAMLRDPSILILDEATSAIDAQSQDLIHASLREFVKGRTTFIITHSTAQSTLDFVTRIVMMDEGRLVGEGTHNELVANCPAYRRLFSAQVEPSEAETTPDATEPPPTDAGPHPHILSLDAMKRKSLG